MTLPEFIVHAAIVIAAYLVGLLSRFGKGYVTEKGKNLATKEDVVEITARVEAVLQQNRLLLEGNRQRHDLRMAALDVRLAAHQRAFVYWWDISRFTHEKDPAKKFEFVQGCQKWWVDNRLYLEPEVAIEFMAVTHAVLNHQDFLQARDMAMIKSNWERIIGLGNVILKAVELPAIKSDLRSMVPIDSAGEKVDVRP
jgi:hypothetical protein